MYSRKSPSSIFFRNSLGVRKKYSTPFCSVPLGGRDVALMEKDKGNPASKSDFIIVDFPLPLGAQNIKSFPASMMKVLIIARSKLVL